MSTPVNHFGGKCPCIPFFIGGQMSEGGNVLHSQQTSKLTFFSWEVLWRSMVVQFY